MPSSTDWNRVFNDLGGLLRGHFRQHFPFQDDGEVSPHVLALRDACEAFCDCVNILLIDAEQLTSPFSKGRYWTLVCYRLARPNPKRIAFHGCIKAPELIFHAPLLATYFDIHDLDWIDELRPCVMWDETGTSVIHVVPFNLAENLEEYSRELWSALSEPLDGLVRQRFERTVTSAASTPSLQTQFFQLGPSFGRTPSVAPFRGLPMGSRLVWKTGSR